MTPPGTLIRIMKASPPWRCGYMPTHLSRSTSPGTALMESRSLLGVGVDDGLRHLEGMPGQLELLVGFSSPMLR